MSRSPNFGGIFDLSRMTAELQELEAKMGQPNFWSDARAAAGVSRRKVRLERELAQWRDIEGKLGDVKALLELALAPDAVVYGDRATITQVLMNLLTNASDALEDRAGVISVRVDRVRDPGQRFQRALGKPVGPGNWVLVEVRDTGTGMDEHTLARVFEPFFTTKTKGESLGLGLSISRTLLEEFGGTLQFSAAPEGGTLASVTLPVFVERSASEAVPA